MVTGPEADGTATASRGQNVIDPPRSSTPAEVNTMARRGARRPTIGGFDPPEEWCDHLPDRRCMLPTWLAERTRDCEQPGYDL